MRILFTALIFFTFASNYFSQGFDKISYNAFSGTTVLTLEGAATFATTAYKVIDPQYLGKTSLEYFFPTYTESSFGIRLFGGTGYIGGKDATKIPTVFRTTLTFWGAGMIYMLKAGETIFPYFFAGGSYLWFDPRNGETGKRLPNNSAHLYSNKEFNFNGELGTRILLTGNLSFNINGGVQISPNSYFDDIFKGTNDLFFHIAAGFSFSFFTDKDSDRDGVPDLEDKCSDTPTGVRVDEFGCPIDSDGDGVPDYLDKCLNTPKNIKVNKDGCPLDSDGDGVPDYVDICPNTTNGVNVDDLGCPYDKDGDGVPDYLDNCPDTPHNVGVDENGCPLDSDHDGIPDYLDKCPDIPAGTKVDAEGCPITVEIQKSSVLPREVVPPLMEVVLSVGSNFVSGKSTLLPAAFPDLNRFIKVIKENPGSRWLIEGYTNNKKSELQNKRFSLDMAKSVLNYFLSKGMQKNKFEVYGRGSANPVATNKNETGRNRNRRVVIRKLY